MQVEGGDPYSLLSTGEARSGELCPVLCWGVQDRYRLTGGGPVKGHEEE